MRRVVIAAVLSSVAFVSLAGVTLVSAQLLTSDPCSHPTAAVAPDVLCSRIPAKQGVTAPLPAVVTQAQGFFAGTPLGNTPLCPDPNQWLLLYWRGSEVKIADAAAACAGADRFWANVGGRWLGYGTTAPAGANDDFSVVTGQALFVHGAAQGTFVTITGIFTIIFGDPPPGSGGGPVQRYRIVDDQGQAREVLIDEQTLVSGPISDLNGRRVKIVGELVSQPAGAIRARSIEPVP